MLLGYAPRRGPSDTHSVTDHNVLGGELEPRGVDPLTGFYRDGCCRTGPEDRGSHTICAVVTAAFLEHQRGIGVIRSLPMPRWCSRNAAVTTAQIVWLPRSSGPVRQHPSR